jgi:hypothetical protein
MGLHSHVGRPHEERSGRGCACHELKQVQCHRDINVAALQSTNLSYWLISKCAQEGDVWLRRRFRLSLCRIETGDSRIPPSWQARCLRANFHCSIRIEG